jgi:hypothetical protein
MPSIWGRSTPVIASSEACTAKPGGLLRRERPMHAGADWDASAAAYGPNAWSHPARCLAHTRDCYARPSSWSTACGHAQRCAARPWPVKAWAIVA